MKKQINKFSRRHFVKSSIIGLASAPLVSNLVAAPKKAVAEEPLKLGLASYSCRAFSLEQTIAMTKRAGLKHLCLKSMHLPLDDSPDQLRAAAAQVNEAGIDLYGCGVVYMKNRDQVNQAFEYAKITGMSVIVGVPEHELLPYVDEKVKNHDIKVAIHNHGPGDEVYPTPASIYEKIKGLDRRIGICMDIGHTQRMGISPIEAAKQYFDRLLDVHIKDVSAATAEGETLEVGRGVIDIPSFLALLVKKKFSGIVSFEYEKDKDDPMPGLAESVGYVKGVLASL